MSDEEDRRVSRQDIQLVQNLIERCLQLYMTRKEVVETLLVQAKIEPGFTELVWQKLEEENKEFFKAYHVRLMVKNQIIIFNKLLQRQEECMRRHMSPPGIVHVSAPNGSQTASVHQAPPSYTANHTPPHARPSNLLCHPAGPNSHHTSVVPSTMIHNGRSIIHGSIHADNIPPLTERMNVSPNLSPAQNSHMQIKQEANGVGGMLEENYSNTFTFGVDEHILEPHQSNGDPSISTFGNMDINSDTINEKLPDTETPSLGCLGQMNRVFSLSDLAAEYSHSLDILGSYPRSPFLPQDNEHSMDGRDYNGQNRKSNGLSEDFNYDDFK